MTRPAHLTVRAGSATARVAKAGAGAPLVYLHGTFGHRGWPDFLDRLSESFTVYAPVHPGFDETGGVEGIDDILDLTLYHVDLLDSLELERPHLAGHHFGAMIAAEIAAINPQRVDRLVLASPAGLWLDDAPGVDYFATPADELRALLFSDPDSHVARSAMPEPADDEERQERSIERSRSLSTVAKFLWPIPDKGLAKRLRRIRSRTLVAVADDDPVVPPEHGEAFANAIPDCRLSTFRGAGHLYPLERPGEFAQVVAEFLRS